MLPSWPMNTIWYGTYYARKCMKMWLAFQFLCRKKHLCQACTAMDLMMTSTSFEMCLIEMKVEKYANAWLLLSTHGYGLYDTDLFISMHVDLLTIWRILLLLWALGVWYSLGQESKWEPSNTKMSKFLEIFSCSNLSGSTSYLTDTFIQWLR